MKKLKIVLGCLLVVSFLLAACAPAATAPAAPAASSEKAAPAAPVKSEPVAAPAKSEPAAAPAKSAAPAAAPAKAGNFDALYEAAKKEGEVVWHSAVGPEVFTDLLNTFQKRFPGVKVTSYSLTAPQLPPRIITEQQAGRVSTDVGTGGMSTSVPLLERDLLVPVDYASFGVDQKRIVLDSKAVIARDMPFGVIYNTQQVAAADVPQKWEDLLNPKFTGRIGMQTMGTGFEGVVEGKVWDVAKLTAFLKQFKSQKIMATDRTENIIQKVASGELLIGLVVLTVVAEEKAKGAPLGLAPLGPELVQPQEVFVIKGGPHPNAGKLFAAWLGTAEATPGWTAANWGPLNPCTGPLVIDKFFCEYKDYKYVHEDTLEQSKQTTDIRKIVADTLGLTAQ